MLCIAQAAAGLCAGVALPAIYGLAADVGPNGRESETLGKVLTGWTLSLVAGVSLSAVVSDLVGWRAVYAVLAIGAAALALAIGRGAMIGSGIHHVVFEGLDIGDTVYDTPSDLHGRRTFDSSSPPLQMVGYSDFG